VTSDKPEFTTGATLPPLRTSPAGFADVVAVWLIAGYLVPHTVIDAFSARQVFFSDLGGVSTAMIVILLIATLIIGVIYMWLSRRSWAKLLLSAAAFLYITMVALEGVLHHRAQADLAACYLLSSGLFAGLLAALLGRGSANIAANIVGLAVIEALLALFGLRSGHEVFWSGGIARAAGTGEHPELLYPSMLLTIPIALTAALLARDMKRRIVFGVAAGILCSVLMLTWMRGGIFAAACSIAWLLHRSLKPSRSVLGIIAVLLLAVPLCSLYVRSVGAVNSASTVRSNHGHWELPRLGMAEFLGHIWLGVGVGRVQFTVHEREYGQEVIAHYSKPKNQMLFWLDQFGRSGGPVKWPLSSIWIGAAVACTFDTPFGALHHEGSNCLLGLLIGATLLMVEDGPSLSIPVSTTALREVSETP